MAKMPQMIDLLLNLGIERISKLECLRVECVHNRMTDCNLKAVTLDGDGRCMEFAQKRPKPPKE